MSTVAESLTDLLRTAAHAAGHADLAIEPVTATADAKNGDYQSNLALRVAKALKISPRAFAEKIVASWPTSAMVTRVDIAGPGFINLTLTDEWLGADVAARSTDPRLGAPRSGEGKTVVIDYSSPNIAKRMHVGHLRSTIIGAALHRLYAFLGWTVIADNHVGDWGTQFGKLIVAWHAWRDDAAYAADPIAELQRIYVLFGDKAKDDPALEDRARAETAKLQEGDPENRALWERFVAVSMTEFDRVYARLGVKFDVVHGESYYRDQLQPLITDLLARGIAVENEGAAIIPLGDIDPALAEQPLLVRKRDGAALYGTTDLATIADRRATWAPARMVYVVDVRQSHHFVQLFAAAKKLGWTDSELIHVHFGMLRLPGGAIVSTRKGPATGAAAADDVARPPSVNLIDVLDAAVVHAKAVVDGKSAHLPEAERAAIAEAVGIGAIRYADLSQNPQSDVTFDWKRMLSLEGNTAPYLMYAYARCRNIFVKAEITAFAPSPVTIAHPAERALALLIVQTPEAILAASRVHRPNLVAEHLFAVANALGRFYDECPVIKAETPEIRQSRLTLVDATAKALRVGLELLGLQALDRM